jgi:predicted DsbA family dithiol-disulfide isomerase
MYIQVVHDLVCPWCRIGKHHLDSAMAAWAAEGGEPIDIQWFPFQLDPLPAGAGENFRKRFIERKGMNDRQVDGMFLKVARIGAAEGLDFHFDRIDLAQNTLLAHQAIALAPIDRQSALIDALHEAYFVDGGNLESIELLVKAATAVGVENISDFRHDLEAGARAEDIAAQIAQASAAGIGGVPFFIIDGKVGLSGAQPTEEILEAIRSAAASPAPA